MVSFNLLVQYASVSGHNGDVNSLREMAAKFESQVFVSAKDRVYWLF